MSSIFSYRMVDKQEILKLCDIGRLEKCNWSDFLEDNIFIIFSENGTDVGVVECSIHDNNVAFIEMIEVFSQFRGKTYGEQMVKQLQDEHNVWCCVPIDTSYTFFRKLGFSPSINHPQFWYWYK